MDVWYEIDESQGAQMPLVSGHLGMKGIHPMAQSKQIETVSISNDSPVPVAQVRHLALFPSTSWDYECPATLRYLNRQKHRAETALGLAAVIVRDQRGFVSLWTGDGHDLSVPSET